MCTPWNTKRSGSSLNDRMPLQRRMLGPSVATRSCTQGKNLSGLSGLSVCERDRLHVLVVIVLEPAVDVAVVMIVMMIVAVIMIVVVLMVVGFEEFRLDVEDAVEIEGVAAEHLGDVDLARAACGAAWRKD